MVSVHRSTHRVAAFIAALTLLFSSVAPVANAQTGGSIFLPLITGGNSSTVQALLFRTRVTVRTAAQWRDLTRLNLVVLTKGADWAQLLVDDEQLADLARLRYNPTVTDALDTLAVHAADVRASFVDLLSYEKVTSDQLSAISAQSAVSGPQSPVSVHQSLHTQLRAALHVLSAAQLTTLTQAPRVDSDNDGLTDDQEGFWCTDPAKADSDGDGVKDGAEINILKAWMNNERSGPPNSTPWPDWPASPTSPTCPDKDRDSIPNLAESLELGLNPDLESTDGDKFDDGEELFGVTDCPGGDASCGYGHLPRSEDTGYIGSKMPSWVKPPGNHPLVAAFPAPKIEVIESSFHIQTVTTVTTDHTISSGTEKSYSTAKTEGTSTGIEDTVSWNDWDELALTTQANSVSAAGLRTPRFGFSDVKQYVTNAAQSIWDSTDACLKSINGGGDTACNRAVKMTDKDWGKGLAKITTSAVGAVIHTISDIPNIVQNATDPAKCSGGVLNQISCGVKAAGTKLYNEFYTRLGQQAEADQEANGQASGNSYSLGNNQIGMQPIYQLSYPAAHFTPTQTSTHGTSHGGSHSTTHTQYEQNTVTNGEAFSNGEAWGNATAVDSTHAADFWFSFTLGMFKK